MGESGNRFGIASDCSFDGFLSGLGFTTRSRLPFALFASGQAELLADIVRVVDHGALHVEDEAHRFGIAARLSEAQPESMAVLLDADQLHRDNVAFFDDVFRVLNPTIRKFRNVDEALNRAIETDKGAERHELGHAPDQDLADDEAVDGGVPLLRLGSLERKRDLLRLAVDLQDKRLDLITDTVEVARLLAALPREFGHMREAVRAAKIDEDTEVGDR